jgi:hypothetical protein
MAASGLSIAKGELCLEDYFLSLKIGATVEFLLVSA